MKKLVKQNVKEVHEVYCYYGFSAAAITRNSGNKYKKVLTEKVLLEKSKVIEMLETKMRYVREIIEETKDQDPTDYTQGLQKGYFDAIELILEEIGWMR